MARAPKALKITAAALAILATIVIVGLVVVTNTNWGRERVRAFSVDRLAGQVAGQVTVGRVSGNLLTGATIAGIAIRDSSGAPFLIADTVRLDYSLRSFISKHLVFDDVRLINPVVVLDQPPGEEWNFVRLFPQDTAAAGTTPGFGSWVRLEDVSVRNGTFIIRSEWKPSEALTDAEREAAIDEALSASNRRWVIPVADGFQTMMLFRDVDLDMPLMRIAHPDSAARVFEVASLRGTAFMFRPPATRIQDLSGLFVLTGDTLHFSEAHAVFPGTRLAAEGWYLLETGGLSVEAATDPIEFADFRWLHPALPAGGGRMAASARSAGGDLAVRLVDLALRSGSAVLGGHAEVAVGESLRFGDTRLSFSGVHTGWVQDLLPDLVLPVEGTAEGQLALTGTPAALNVDGRIEFHGADGSVSRLVADGVLGTGDHYLADRLRVSVNPLQMDLVRAFAPDLVLDGYLTGHATLSGSTASEFALDGDLAHVARAGRSRVLADGVILPGDAVSVRDLRIRLDPMQARVLHAFAPDLPVEGTITGAAWLSGSAGDLALTADLVHLDPHAGRSRVLADGRIALGDAFSARNLQLRFDPFQIALLRPYMPSLPIDGTVGGRATVDGSTATSIGVGLDMIVATETGSSHLVGRAAVIPDGGPRFEIALDMPLLSLETVGAFAPAAGLHGTAGGGIRAEGTAESMVFAMDLGFVDGGALTATGGLRFGRSAITYDVESVVSALDASVVSSVAPRTRLTGSIDARGTGTEPATLTAALRARLEDVQVEQGYADSTLIDASVQDGVIQVERGQVRMASARADVDGSFGLVEGTAGTLRFSLDVEALSDFGGWIPGDTMAIHPRPVLQSRRIAAARADSLRIFLETEVERLATGYPPPPRLDIDSLPPLRGDSIAGSVRLDGVLTGNIARSDTRGEFAAADFLAAGISIDTATGSYAISDFGSDNGVLEIGISAETVQARGFAFDSTTIRAEYGGRLDHGRGGIDVVIHQDTLRDYRIQSDFTLELDQREILLNDLALRFDTVTWTTTGPSEIGWSGGALKVDSLLLISTHGGRFLIDADIPQDGELDVRMEVERFRIGHVVALLQDTVQADGYLDLEVALTGSRSNPAFEGRTEFWDGGYGGRELPDARATFDYAEARLGAAVEVGRGGDILMVADGELPLNLSLDPVEGSRALDRPMRIEARMDSLPLEALPSFTDAVSDVRGRLRGNLTVTGTFDDPRPEGVVDLDLASLNVVAAGISLRDVAGMLTITPEVVTLDSLVAWSGGGRIQADGSIGLMTLTEPRFDLAISADGARVLDNEYGRLRANADVTIAGPLDSLAIGGDIAIVDGVLYAPEMDRRRATDLDDPAVASIVRAAGADEELLPPVNPLLEALHLDVEVRISRNTWVRNSAANVEIYTPDGAEPLRIRMAPDTDIAMEGVINADRGEYVFSGRVFELSTGSVTLLGGPEFDPLLQLTARYDIPRPGREALAILIHVDGPLSEPRLSLESNAQPPISQSDMLAYLAFGRSSSSLLSLDGSGVSGGDGIGALAQQQLGGLAVGALLDEAVSSIEREGTRAGLDVFRVRPADLPDELAFSGYLQNILRGTEVVAGKYFGGRLFVAAQGRTTTQAWPGFRVEYLANRGFSLEATWEPRFMPTQPTLASDQEATSARTFGTFLRWRERF